MSLRCSSSSKKYKQPIEGVPYTVNYSYDAASRLIATITPDQSEVTYEYDSFNRLVTIPGYAEFTYNDDSLLATMSYSNNVVTSFQYDNRNRPVSIEAEKNDTDLVFLQYQYDPVGNITQLDYNRRLPDHQWVQSTEIFQYDWLDRLVSAEGDYGLLSYTYDPAGNRLSLNDVIYTYNDMNELLSISDGTTFNYDNKGNTITKITDTDTWSYTYNRNMLTQVEKNQHIIAQYTYDGDGRRIKKTEWIESLQEYHTFIYVYSGTDVAYEKNVNTGQEATYIQGEKGIIAKTVNGLTEYYTTDHVGSTRLITDENGTILSETEYTPFGSTDKEGFFLYIGKEKDSTGLYYYGARYYDPDIGRFITRDPLKGKVESPQTLNRYSYCLNNPLKYVDPRGLDCEFVILPDGTISYELADLYNKMQKALNSMTEEEWEMLNDLLAPGTELSSKLDAVKLILDKAGIESKMRNDVLEIDLGEMSFTITFKDLPFPIWGQTQRTGISDEGEILLSNHIHKGGDLFLVLGHELAHAYMISFHEDRITSMETQFGKAGGNVYMELISYQWEFGILNEVPHVTLMQRETIEMQYNKYKLVWPLIRSQGVR
ncbi:MAG: RHS repeat-associated core domain-containing protein [Candidatus Methanofastidiosia archaeon]|jgi:RHS repeat-associated protein